MQPLLSKTQVGSRLYWGDQQFVDIQISLLESGGGKRLGSGSFGVGWAVGPYLVKKTHNTPKTPQSAFVAEADAANMLQSKIPDFVTQLKGARYGSNDNNDYIIFDLLQGDTLTGYIKKLQVEAIRLNMTSSTLHRNFSYLFQALKMSSKAMTAAGWSHCDLKPDNVFFNVQKNGDLYDWSTAVCWLIDFGSATQFGKQLPYSVTPIYSITWLKNESKHPNADCALPIGTIDQLIRDIEINACKEKTSVSEKYNAASCDLIWLNDMKKRVGSAPKKPLTIEELNFTTEQDYLVMRKGLIDRLRSPANLPVVVQLDPLSPLPANPPVVVQRDPFRPPPPQPANLPVVNVQQAAQHAAQQAKLNAMKAPKEPYFTGKKEVRNGMMYKEVTDGKDTWWEDLNRKPYWVIPSSGSNAAREAADAIAIRKAAFNAQFKGGSRRRRRQRRRQSRQSRRHRII